MVSGQVPIVREKEKEKEKRKTERERGKEKRKRESERERCETKMSRQKGGSLFFCEEKMTVTRTYRTYAHTYVHTGTGRTATYM